MLWHSLNERCWLSKFLSFLIAYSFTIHDCLDLKSLESVNPILFGDGGEQKMPYLSVFLKCLQKYLLNWLES